MKKSLYTIITVMAVLFVLSGAIILVGALGKLQHVDWASQALTIGICIQIVAYILGVIALIKHFQASK